MALRNIDLNLLVVFEAIMAERNITRAADKIGLSQSAMSHALRRPRETFNDDLVRRTPRGMVPTPRALKMANAVRGALQQIEHVVDEQLKFDPKTSVRSFTVSMSDYLTGCLLPRICARVRAEAPRVTLFVNHPPLTSIFDPNADVQLLVCNNSVEKQGFRRERLLQDRFVTVLRNGHPAAKKKMTLNLFLDLPQLRVTSAATGPVMLDEKLAQGGFSRNVVLWLPCLTGIVPVIKSTDLCAILPKRWLKRHSAPGELATSPLPMTDIEFTVDQIGTISADQDPGLRWLNRLVREEFRALYPTSGKAVR